jgi:hypothetical protein
MPSDLKSETARTDGAKSRSPKTPEGLAASSRNAEIQNQRTKIDTTDSGVHLAAAFRTLADDSSALVLSSRYETRLHRIQDRDYKTLRKLEQNHPPLQPTDSESPPAPDPPPTENCETNPAANETINISNTDAHLHFPKSCRRLYVSDVERKSNPISAPRRPTPTPCKQHYYCGHRIRPRVRPFGRVSEGHQRG